MGKIADLMKVFKEPEWFDFDRFPKFSQRKKELKETEKGVMEMSGELQQLIDREKAEAERKERKDMVGLMNYLWSNGRGDDAKKASEDEIFLAKLLADFRDGVMVAK